MPRHVILVLSLLIFMSQPAGSAASESFPSTVAPAHADTAVAVAAVSTTPLSWTSVQVPAELRAAPFNEPRTLKVPRGLNIAVYARIPHARFLLDTPDGNLLVSVPNDGKIVLVRAQRNGAPVLSDFVTGLQQPQGMAFHTIAGTTYLYVGERNQIDRYVWRSSAVSAGQQQVIVRDLPYGPTADGDTHPLKDLAFSPSGQLYAGIGSSCNACTNDRSGSPQRGTIYRYNADGTGQHLVARGLRNAEGLAFVPGTTTLWVTVNERDNILYPFADSTQQYGKLVRSYVDNHPPDELTAVRDGGDYGWPYCNPNPDTKNGYDDMPLDPDYQFNQRGAFNARGALFDCSKIDRVSKGIQAHSAPLALVFLQGTSFPRQFQPGAVVALHGSWDRSARTGYKVVYFPWLGDRGSGHPGTATDLVTGWLDSKGDVWDRPAGVAVDPKGNLLISGDLSGAIYRLSAQP